MKIYPAIDLKEGRCVRLIRGEAKSGRVYGDPIEWAKRWEAEGAQYLHVVDLDAAFTGEFVNKDVVKKIVTSVKIPVQLGGGVRTKDGVKQRLDEIVGLGYAEDHLLARHVPHLFFRQMEEKQSAVRHSAF